LAGERTCITGPVMQIDCHGRLIVTNEETIYVDPFPKGSAKVESLKKS
jgi:hypothetical protein